MNVNRYILIFCLIGLTGCSSGVRQGWYDFRAYYNTLYNAIRYYEAGLNSHQNQLTEINPERPIRIHIPPSGAGSNDFAMAIEAATDVIQRHSRSGYRDRALEIIGKSHYYSENHFAALEVFLNLNENSSSVQYRQNALIWEGRVYLEMGIPEEGIPILMEKLDNGVIQTDEEQAELLLIIAQMHSELGNYTEAAELLTGAVDDVGSFELRGRALFLLGQLYELNEQKERALETYSLVLDNRPSFDLEYQARRKTGEIFRETGRYNLALEQFRAMQRDDKFRNRLPEIVYEQARTEHLRGELASAVRLYNNVLRNRERQTDEQTLTKVYYSLAEVNENVFGDLQTAAAYYDSAGSRQVNQNLLPEEWKIEENAYAFGEYADLRRSLSQMENRLELGMMEPEERSATLEVIRREQENETEQNRQSQSATLPIPADAYSETEESVNTFGFLNVNNPILLESGRREFRNYWGERPLVDNWRRSEAAFGTRPVGETVSADDRQDESELPTVMNVNREEIPFTDIPVTEEDLQQVRMEIYELYYQLGNLFLMNLQMPDSANSYFQNVLQNDAGEELKARALFGLSEIALQENDEVTAGHLRDRLIEEFPESETAREIFSRPGGGSVDTDSVRIRYSAIMSDSLSARERAESLHQLALENESDPRSARILLDAAAEYIRSSNSRESAEEEDVFINSARTILVQLDSLFPESPENSRGQILRQALNSNSEVDDDSGTLEN